MLINDKVDAVYIPDSPSRIKANDYNQIKNEIQECITEAGLTPTKDVIQLPQALKILTEQSGAEEVAKIEAAGNEQLNAVNTAAQTQTAAVNAAGSAQMNNINTAGAQAVQDAQDAANTATAKAAEASGSATDAAGSASAAASSASAASGSASTATTQASNAADSAASANTSASQATTKAMEASASASQASQSAIDAANSAASAHGLQIGTVFFSQSSLSTDNPGGLPLWTGEYYVNASTLYPDFYAWVKSHTELCKTKAEYDSAIATYGECPYYVVDEVEGSLRLPKLVNYIKSANATEGITQSKAGLPDISFPMYGEGGAINNHLADGGDSTTGKTWSASAFNQIYGASDTVTPASTTLYPWVYAFNAAVPASTAQAAEFTGALAGKANADWSNCPANYDYVVESYKDDQGNWYRKYKSGWLEQGGLAYSSSGETTVTLLKPYADTGFAIIATNCQTNNINAFGWVYISSKTTTGFTIKSRKGNADAVTCNAMWEAKGQGAE